MKLTLKKKNELEVWEYFMPDNCKWLEKTDKDIEMFFEWSEQGKHKELIGIPTFKPEGRTYFHALVQGKKWAGITVHELYEQGVLDGSMPYFVILGGNDIAIKRKWYQFWKPKHEIKHKPMPRAVVDFIKKEMFKGMDCETIEYCYRLLSTV